MSRGEKHWISKAKSHAAKEQNRMALRRNRKEELCDGKAMFRRKKGDKMKNFTKGVNYYTRGTVALLFPEDDLCCWRCPLMGKDLAIDREICKCTGEILLSPKEALGGRCPMIFEEIGEGDFNE